MHKKICTRVYCYSVASYTHCGQLTARQSKAVTTAQDVESVFSKVVRRRLTDKHCQNSDTGSPMVTTAVVFVRCVNVYRFVQVSAGEASYTGAYVRASCSSQRTNLNGKHILGVDSLTGGAAVVTSTRAIYHDGEVYGHLQL